jgi:hypothetical protein
MTIYVSEIMARLLARYPRAECFWQGSLDPRSTVVVLAPEEPQESVEAQPVDR